MTGLIPTLAVWVCFVWIQIEADTGWKQVLVLEVRGKQKVDSVLEVSSLRYPKIDVWQATTAGLIVLHGSADDLASLLRHLIGQEILTGEEQWFYQRLPDIKINYSRRKVRSVQDFNQNAFNTFETIMDFLDVLAKNHPALCRLERIGVTSQNRVLKLIRVTSPSSTNKVKVFMDATAHGREWITTAVLLNLLQQLVTGAEEGTPEILRLLDKYEFHLLPVFNPDGYVYTYAKDGDRMWRKNRKTRDNATSCAGVDLNRNWDFHWSGPGSSKTPCSDMYCGAGPNSEAETQTVAAYIMKQSGWHSYFSFHSFGQMILFPWSHTSTPSPDFDKHLAAGKKLAEGIKSVNNTSYLVGCIGIILYTASGSSESWAYGAAGFPYAYSLELPDRSSFIVNADIIAPTAREFMQGFLTYFDHIEQADPDSIYNRTSTISMEFPRQSTIPTNAVTTVGQARVTRDTDQTHLSESTTLFTASIEESSSAVSQTSSRLAAMTTTEPTSSPLQQVLLTPYHSAAPRQDSLSFFERNHTNQTLTAQGPQSNTKLVAHGGIGRSSAQTHRDGCKALSIVTSLLLGLACRYI